MEKIKLKCCPFCGCDQMTFRHYQRYGLIHTAYVECDQCLAKGSPVDESDLMDGFTEVASGEEIKAAFEELAAGRWNCRPPMADCYPEDLEDLEKQAKREGGALYGSSVYKD